MVIIGIILSIVLSYLSYWLGARYLFVMFPNDAKKKEVREHRFVSLLKIVTNFFWFTLFWCIGFFIIYAVANTALGRFPFTLDFIFTSKVLSLMAMASVLLGIERYRLRKSVEGRTAKDVALYCCLSVFIVLLAITLYY